MQMEIYLLENRFFIYRKTFGILIMPVVFWFMPIDNSKTDFTLCLFKNLTGRNCFGCGISRATLSVIHFDFIQAFTFNKLVIFIFPILAYLWTKRLFKEWKKTHLSQKV